MVKNGRPAAPRALQVQFWEGVRSGLGVTEARLAAGVGNEMAFGWFKQVMRWRLEEVARASAA